MTATNYIKPYAILLISAFVIYILLTIAYGMIMMHYPIPPNPDIDAINRAYTISALVFAAMGIYVLYYVFKVVIQIWIEDNSSRGASFS